MKTAHATRLRQGGTRSARPAACVGAARRQPLRVVAMTPPFVGDGDKASATLAPPKPPAKTPSPPVPAPPPVPTAPAAPLAAPPSPASQLYPTPGQPAWPPKRSFTAVAIDNVMDSAVDVGRHLRRMYDPRVAAAAPSEQRALLENLVPGDGGRMRLRSINKPVVLVLGSGWGAHALIKVIDTDSYDVVVVSPRNHFVFTPMLPSTAVGTVEFRSLLEPIRTSNPCVTYLEAECEELNPDSKVAVCRSAFAMTDGSKPTFEIQYDKAVVAVGEQPATFGVPGVRENCFFMKEISDASALRKRIAEQFEAASIPGLSDAKRAEMLHFIVVGGGPAGVETAGALSDFFRQDMGRRYPFLADLMRVTVLQNVKSILTQFDGRLADQAAETMRAAGVEVRTSVSVVGVTKDIVKIEGPQGVEEIPYGVCVWSAGNAPRPLVKQIAGQVPMQAAAAEASRVGPGSKLCVDSFLRVVGARDLMCLGDCSLVLGNRLPPTAQVAGQQGSYLAHLINSGYTLGVGGYTQPPPFQAVKKAPILAAADRSETLQWLALALAGGRERILTGQEVVDAIFRMDAPPWIRSHAEALTGAAPLDAPSPAAVCDIVALRALAAAAGGADPEALARASSECLRSFEDEERAARAQAEAMEVRYWDRPFEFLNLGMMAYVGNNRALTQVEAFDVLNLKMFGTFAFLLWKSVYITKQVSFRNRVLILFDWLKARMFGRDISLF
ncbi:hypothetical protein HYH03_013931 [Edaphochlamys debaryana]|uniref:NADH:ubiquinone reductase (non-electrogenic) n=1 Tax=Edaphochlamys debaryana TaxID=47281 RepID=A0A836BU28_9CHLO|nr:hypothetical protein HYH03_013931 [Edaphochlamys debaryana]|eukprot:KAG2487513.1 hypothetical protein HYH03_013931 [Edaphochlamys debaryana]